MARIPLLGTKLRVNENPSRNPTRSVSSAGLVEKAQGQFFKQATNFASELETRRDQSDIVNYRNNSVSDFNKASRDKMAELQQLHAGTDYAGSTEDYTKWQKQWLTEREALAPSSKALEVFRSSTVASRGNNIAKANNTEMFNRAKMHTSSDNERTVQMAQDALHDPDLVQIADDLLLEETWVEGNRDLYYNGNKDVTDAIVKSKYSEVRKGAIQGAINQGLVGIVTPGAEEKKQLKEIDDFLAGKNPNNASLLKGMGPAESQSYRNKMVARLKADSKQNTKELESLVKDIVTVNTDPDISAAKSKAISSQIASKIGGVKDPLKRADMLREVDLSEQAGFVLRAANEMPQEEFLKLVAENPQIPKEIKGAADIKKYNQIIKSGLKKSANMRKNNPKDFVRSIRGNMPHADLYKEQKKLGLDAQYLNKDEAALEANKILEGVSISDQVLRLNEFKAANKENYRQAFAEMKKSSSSLGTQYLLASQMDNIESQKIIIGNAKNSKDITQNFNESPNGDIFKDSMNTAIDDQLLEMNAVFTAYRATDDFIDIKRSVQLESKRLFMDGLSSTKGNYRSSVKKAIETIVDSSMVAVADTTLGRTPRYLVSAPKDINRTSRDLKDSFNSLLTPERLDSLGVSPSQFGFADSPSFVNVFTNGTFGSASKFLDMLHENTTIVNSKDGKGVSLMFHTPSMGESNLITKGKKNRQGGVSALENIDGEVIVIPWKDLP